MTTDQIEKFLVPKYLAKVSVKIDFKTRNSLIGIFIMTGDYQELKTKNFWRIVTGPNVESWKKTSGQWTCKNLQWFRDNTIIGSEIS